METGRPRRKPGGRKFFPRRKVCQFCVDKVTIDYKDVQRIRRFISEWGKIESRRKTGTCSTHQRQLATAIKRARYLAWLPYTGSHSQMDLGRPDRGGPRGPRPPFQGGMPPNRDYAPPSSDAPTPEVASEGTLAVSAATATAEGVVAVAEAPEPTVAETPTVIAPAAAEAAESDKTEPLGEPEDTAAETDK